MPKLNPGHLSLFCNLLLWLELAAQHSAGYGDFTKVVGGSVNHLAMALGSQTNFFMEKALSSRQST